MKINVLKVILFIQVLLMVTVLNAQEESLQRTAKSGGMLAYPYPVSVEQPDGTTVTISGRGNGLAHWYETEDGYTVLKDQNGYYKYAILNEEQDMVLSEYILGSQDVPEEILQKKIRFSERQLAGFSKSYYPTPDSKANPTPFPSTGSHTVLLVLVEFPDVPAIHTVEDFSSLMNDPAYNNTGSFRDYYLSVSYNTLSLYTEVVPWVQVSEGMSFYGQNDAEGNDLNPQLLVREAIDSLEARGFDFSLYDNDGDGYVEDVVFIHSGFGEHSTGAGDTCIWSHAFQLGDLAVEYDGVMIDNYLISSELFGNSGTEINSIGTIVHEFAHSLAVPDLYDLDYGESGGLAFDLNQWDLMASGSWNNDGYTPAGMNAWLKRRMGWMSFPILSDAGTYQLNSAFTNQEAYQINTPVYNEYYVIENRQQSGFDSYIPGSGMLIYHIDLNYPGYLTGDINVDPLHQGFDLEEADGTQSFDDLPGDAFPGTSGNTSFNATSNPSSNTWDGNESNVSIENISEVGGVISFDLVSAQNDELPAGWKITSLSYAQGADMVARVVLDGDTVSQGYIAAFYNGECRGIANSVYFSNSDSYLFDLKLYSNATGGEIFDFKYYDPILDQIYDLYETVEFSADSIYSTEMSPSVFHTPVTYEKSLSTGWNWFGLNIQMDDMTPGNVMSLCTSGGDYLKSQTHSTTYYAGWGWFGNMTVMNNKTLYLIKTQSPCGISYSGLPVDPASNPISLVPGWNWISYSPVVPMSPGEALSSLSPSNMDYIKNQTQSSTYYSGWGWFGNMLEMKPGDGYMMRMAAGGTLVFPSSTQKKAAVKAARTVENAALDPHLYQYNGTITARINIAEEDVTIDDILYAYCGEECRGAIHGLYFDPVDEILFPLMVYGDKEAGEKLHFTFFSAKSKKYYALNETIEFEKDIVQGDAFNAVELSAGAVEVEEHAGRITANKIELYPSPASDHVVVRFQMNGGNLNNMKILDLQGREIQYISDAGAIEMDGELHIDLNGIPAGMYIISISIDDEILNKPLLIAK